MSFLSFRKNAASTKGSQRGLKPRHRGVNARMSLERLEERLVLSQLDVTAGMLTYGSITAGQASNVDLTLAAGVITFSDTDNPITLTANAIAAGFTNSGPFVVTGPDANVNQIAIDTGNANATITDGSSDKPVTINPASANGPETQAVFLGNTSFGVQQITAPVIIANAEGTTTLTVDDSHNTTTSKDALITGDVSTTATIAGLTGAGNITIGTGALKALNILGGSAGANFFSFGGTTGGGTAAPTTTLTTINGSFVFVNQLDAGDTLNILNQSAVNDVTIGNSTATGQLGLGGVKGTINVGNTPSNPTGVTALGILDTESTTANTFAISGTQTKASASGAVINYSGSISNFSLSGGSGGNTFTVTSTPGPVNDISTGTGVNTVNLEGTAAGSTTDISSQGVDQVTIGNAHLVSGILGTSVDVTTTGLLTLTVDDSLDANPTTATIGTAALTGLTPGPIDYTLTPLSRLNVEGGNGGNSFTISNPGTNAYPTFVTSGTGNDTFTFTNQASLSGGTITGGGGSDTLNYAAYTTPVAVDLYLSPQTATGTAGTMGIDNVVGGSDGNFLVAPIGAPSVLTGGAGNDTFIIPASAGSVTVTGGGGLDDLQIYAAGDPESFDSTNPTDTPGSISTVVTGAFATHTVAATGINTLELTGGLIVPASVSPGMTDTGSTTATLDFSGGNPIPAGGVTYTGGGGTTNELILVNDIPTAAPDSFTNEVYNATGPGAGNISLSDAAITSAVPSATNSVVTFSGLSPVIDSVTVTNYTFNAPLAPPQGNNIGITSDPAVNGFAGTLIASTDTPAGFESAAVANKTNVTVNSIVPSDTTVTVTDPTAGTLLSTLSIFTGAGNDYINLVSTPTAVTLAANSGDGNDTFNVNGGGLGGPASINAGTATNTLIYDADDTAVAEVPGANSAAPSTLQLAPLATTSVLTFTNFTTVNVNNIADLPLTNTPAAITVQEGQTFTGTVGTFTVSNPTPIANQINPTPMASDFVASINWGDGTTTAGTIVPNGTGGFDVIGSHAYALATTPGTDPITVTVTHNSSTSTTTVNGTTTTLETPGGSTTTIASTAMVTDVPITVVPAPVLATEVAGPGRYPRRHLHRPQPVLCGRQLLGHRQSGLPGAATIPATITASTLPGTYLVTLATADTFPEEGLYNVTVTITETGGLVAVSTGTATVKDAALTATGTAVIATDGNSFTGQVATFTDANPVAPISDFTVSMNWGDGVITPGTVTQPGGVGTAFDVTGTHTYKAGSYPITVTIVDAGGSTATATSTATVAAASLVPDGPGAALTVVEEQPFTAELGLFHVRYPLSNLLQFSASIAWGDVKMTSTGTITQSAPGVFAVTGTHTFAEASNTRAYTVTVTDDAPGGTTTTITGSATVDDHPLDGNWRSRDCHGRSSRSRGYLGRDLQGRRSDGRAR